MFNYKLYKIDYQLFNELKVNRIRIKLPSNKGGSETVIRCLRVKLTFSRRNSATRFLVLKILDKEHIYCPCSPHRVAQKFNFVHYLANNAGR